MKIKMSKLRRMVREELAHSSKRSRQPAQRRNKSRSHRSQARHLRMLSEGMTEVEDASQALSKMSPKNVDNDDVLIDIDNIDESLLSKVKPLFLKQVQALANNPGASIQIPQPKAAESFPGWQYSVEWPTRNPDSRNPLHNVTLTDRDGKKLTVDMGSGKVGPLAQDILYQWLDANMGGGAKAKAIIDNAIKGKFAIYNMEGIRVGRTVEDGGGWLTLDELGVSAAPKVAGGEDEEESD